MTSDDPTVQLAGRVPGQTLAQYHMLRQVGAGAMGVVHLARDVDLDRLVALKLLHDRPTPEADLFERFMREARSAARVIHPHVALVYQVGREGRATFIVMEWLDGGDLSQRVKAQGKLPWREAAAAVRDAAAGLSAAHAAGLVHRDLKPSNLMRNQAGQVKLVDFGLARLHEWPSELTVTGHILGTPAYLSPEQCNGEPATPASDLYALGCTLFHLLTGRPPFGAPLIAAVINSHLNEALPDPRRWATDVPEAVCRIVVRACAKRPADRHASAAQMADELQAALDELDAGHDLARSPLLRPAPPMAADVPPQANPGRLPLPTSSFVGRERELVQLSERIRASRLVTLAGAGGCGKTRLALELARHIAGDFSDAAWFVELASLSKGESLVAALCAHFGLRDKADRAASETLLEHLRPRRLLLVLDNCEHVVEAAAVLARQLLEGCAQLHLLVTSRQPLALAGEQVFTVAPLPCGAPGNGDPATVVPAALPALASLDAVRLFFDRARAVRPGFAASDDNLRAVAQICRRIDGIPLAIELAAARVNVLSAVQIAARLDDAFKLLGRGDRSLLPRQQTLRALIDWSWDLLDDAERALLARLSVFPGDFSLEAAEAIVGDADVDMLDGMAGLVDKSLLVSSEQSEGMRYRLLQTIRQFAAEKHAATGSTSALQRRHAEYFTARVELAAAQLNGAEHALGLGTLECEHHNAASALDAAIEHEWIDLGLRLASDLAKYWLIAGRFVDGAARVERLLAENPPPGAELAVFLSRAAPLAAQVGRYAQAQQWYERGLMMARDAARPEVEARLHNGLGLLAAQQGRLDQALDHASQACRLWHEVGDRLNEGIGLCNLGRFARKAGQSDLALRSMEDGMTALLDAGSPRLVAYGHLSVAEVEHENGRVEAARKSYQASLNMLSELGDEDGEAFARSGLGECALAVGDLPEARRCFEQAVVAFREFGDKASLADNLDRLAHVVLLEQQDQQASELAQQSLELRLASENPADLILSLETLAAVHALAEPERSAMLLGCADAQRSTLDAPRSMLQAPMIEALRVELQRRLGVQRFASALADGASGDARQITRTAGPMPRAPAS